MTTIKKIAATAGVLALLAPSAAFAQSDVKGYGGNNNIVAGLEEDSGRPGGGPSAKPQSSGDELPFTGADLGVLAAAGGLLAGLGFGLRRLTHRPTEA